MSRGFLLYHVFRTTAADSSQFFIKLLWVLAPFQFKDEREWTFPTTFRRLAVCVDTIQQDDPAALSFSFPFFWVCQHSPERYCFSLGMSGLTDYPVNFACARLMCPSVIHMMPFILLASQCVAPGRRPTFRALEKERLPHRLIFGGIQTNMIHNTECTISWSNGGFQKREKSTWGGIYGLS